uniref:(northern house mosquito) hypothetical protein n=1 Tax=Culex pipiens TaxID=7175 RepID=A0A8D8BM59_CULPI
MRSFHLYFNLSGTSLADPTPPPNSTAGCFHFTTFSRGTACGNAFPKLLSRRQLPLSNSSQTKTNFKSIVLRQLRFLFVANKSAKLRGVGFPGDAVTNFLVTFQHVNVAR